MIMAVVSIEGMAILVTVAQIWKSSKFAIERTQGKTPGSVIFRLSGPITARDMYGSLSPNELRNTFESVVDGESHALHIRDLTEVPYIDSAGLGLIVTHYVRCRDR
jgi:anti-anti-sigma regulatory factor